MADGETRATSMPDKGIIAGFKEFISRGNAIEMAVGVVLGAAFKAVVDATVDKFLNPLVAGLVGKPNFDNVLEFHIRSAAIQPGAIITQLVNFLLVAAAVYLCIIVPLNKLNRVTETKAAANLLNKIGFHEAAKAEKDPAKELAEEELEGAAQLTLSAADQEKLDRALRMSTNALVQQNQQLSVLSEIRDLMAGKAKPAGD